MRRMTPRVWWSGRAVIGLVVLAAVAPAAWAYVNGGDYHDTRKTFAKKAKADGWVVSFEAPVHGERGVEVAKGVKVAAGDNPAFERHVNQLVGEALKALPEKEAAGVPDEARREVARLAREAIRSAVSGRREVIKKGTTGPLRYQVGVQSFESYWETNYDRREIHALQTGLVPFVALKIVAAEGEKKAGVNTGK